MLHPAAGVCTGGKAGRELGCCCAEQRAAATRRAAGWLGPPGERRGEWGRGASRGVTEHVHPAERSQAPGVSALALHTLHTGGCTGVYQWTPSRPISRGAWLLMQPRCFGCGCVAGMPRAWRDASCAGRGRDYMSHAPSGGQLSHTRCPAGVCDCW
jgi:hypothetical protein